ncbi:type 4a pilus biogenesis protein PilO [Homoserinibacter sp. GY 40078]|uniref:type 4a pilus biogenesis protein PilO n=1 Tax=Homoserinibacter sp. GY 40078 TaxID=2603275 RepID=UPI0011CAA446|nr:hypothetical protein [Homoserinibacter sp. GY 40078]TXK19155.1 hypothetical protein FVQ89_04345 [Homoserinibacter sp. GY 40078]
MKIGTNVWALISGVVIIGLLAGGWFLGVSPLLDAQNDAEQQRIAAASQNQTLQMAIMTLAKEEENLPSYEKRAAELERAIPQDVESAEFLEQVNSLATKADVTVAEFTLGELTPYAPPAGEAADPDLAPTPATDARISPDNFILVPVTISVEGGWNEVLSFIHGVQSTDRLVLVTKITTSVTDTAYSATLSGAMYVLLRPGATQPDADGGDADGAEASTTAPASAG